MVYYPANKMAEINARMSKAPAVQSKFYEQKNAVGDVIGTPKCELSPAYMCVRQYTRCMAGAIEHVWIQPHLLGSDGRPLPKTYSPMAPHVPRSADAGGYQHVHGQYVAAPMAGKRVAVVRTSKHELNG